GPGCNCDRFSEVYNIVFPEFNQLPDGTRLPLKNRGIDTGMGLERLAVVSQGKKSIFETDLFAPIVRSTERALGRDLDEEVRQMVYVAADHARALTFAISDGAIPSNEGRGYILRNILRRALLFGYREGVKEPFLYRVCGAVVELMRQFYPELSGKREQVALIVRAEEERFLRTLEAGLERWEEIRARYQKEGVIPGEELFKLHDTYGFHIELVEELAGDAGLRLDRDGFEGAMAEQKERSRKATFITTSTGGAPLGGGEAVESEFVGYENDEVESELVSFVREKDGGYELVLRRTPFYAEAGGQVGDTGRVVGEGFEFEVNGSYYKHGVRVLRAVLKSGEPKPGPVFAAIDRERRREIERAHTATHLLHSALRRMVGDYVKQEGSLVEPGRLRFDFSAFEPLKPGQIWEVERLVYEVVVNDVKVERLSNVPLEEAKRMGALAFFGDEYGEKVNVVKVGDFSIELCGGTHLRRTGEIGMFRIIAETGVAAGIRRIEALVGKQAFERLRTERESLDRLQEHLGVSEDGLIRRVEALTEETKRLGARLRQLSVQIARQEASGLIENAEVLGGLRLVVGHYPFFEIDELRVVCDRVRELLVSGYAGLLTGAVSGARLRYVVFVSPDLQQRLPAGRLARVVGNALGGGGGGRGDIAEGGGAVERLESGRVAFRKEVAGLTGTG
ncbi:MAG: alanine--tRNA ligase, partial [bacterium]